MGVTVKDATLTNVTLKSTNSGGEEIVHHNVDTLPALPAGTNAIGKVDIAAAGTTQRAAISGNTNGDNTLVAAAPGLKTKVLALVLVATGAVSVRFESGAGGTALTGVMSLAANQALVLAPAMPGYHWFETAVNTLLNLELSAGVQVSGFIVYYQEA